MDEGTLLQTHAEVAIALAGFASVVAALQRPLSPFVRQRFLSLLGLALIQVLGCVLPLWLLPIFDSSATGWRTLSALVLALNGARLWWLVFLPAKADSPAARVVLGPIASRFLWGAGFLSLALLAINLVGVPFEPSFHVYYAAQLGMLMVGFALFADVVVARGDDEERKDEDSAHADPR